VKHILTECVDFNDVRNKHFDTRHSLVRAKGAVFVLLYVC